MYEHYQLKNKANVLLVPLRDTKSVTVLIMYPVGSRYEPQKMNGVSHYIEHLMFKGTQKRKNTLTLTREIDRLGAEYNAFTSKEYTGYYIKTDTEYTQTALDILSDMLFHSTFDAKEMEREKGPIVEELRMYRDNPIMNIETIFEGLLYQGSPLGWDIGGTPEHVVSYKRDEVLAYKHKYYQANNMTVVVAGNIQEETKGWIEKYFGSEKVEGVVNKKYKPYVFGSVKKNDRLIVEQKPTDQAQLMLGFPGFPYQDKRNVTASVLNTILGGSMSSRLFIQIRERRGLAYVIRSVVEQFRDTGYVAVRAGLEPKNINKAIHVIQQEIEKIKEKGVTKRELDDAKTHIRGALTLSLEDSSSQADWYGRSFLFQDKIYTPEERLALIEAVTLDDIQKLARDTFRFSEMRVAVIGNIEKNKIQY